MLHKNFQIVETKAEGDSGVFTALVSVFNNVDSVGDRILPGAYTKTLETWRKSGDPIPIIFNHDWSNPMSHIGVAKASDVKQTPKGLVVKAQLDINENPVAAQVFKLLKRRSLKEFSIGYRVPIGGEAMAEDGANDITEIDLVEAGPTLKGANQATELHAIKALMEEEKPEPRSEQELRKATDELERERVEQRLPDVDAEPTPPPPDPTAVAVEAVAAELRSVKEKLNEPPPPSEKELRLRSERQQREEVSKDLPDPAKAEPKPDPLKQEMAAVAEELKTLQQKLNEPPPPTESELRRRTERLERERLQKDLPAPDPGPHPLQEGLDAVAERLRKIQEEMEKPEPADEDTLRRLSDRLERDRIERDLPQGEPGPPPPHPLEAVLERLTEQMEDLQKKMLEEPPPPEPELRRRTERLQREHVAKTLPKPDPGPDPREVKIAELEDQLQELKERKPEPAPEGELRKLSDRLERERKKQSLPTPDPGPDPAVVALEEQQSALKDEIKSLRVALEAKTEAQLRKEADKRERELLQETLPAPAEPTPEPDRFEALQDELSVLKQSMITMAQTMASESAPTEQELRRDTDRLERAETEKQLPEPDYHPKRTVEKMTRRVEAAMMNASSKRLDSDLRMALDYAGAERWRGSSPTAVEDGYVYVDDFDPDAGWVIFCVSGAGTHRYVRVAYASNADGSVTLGSDETEVVKTTSYRPKAGAVEQEEQESTRTRSSDALRRRSDQTVLEIQSDGASLRKPPKPTQQPKREVPGHRELKRRSYENILATLTGENDE